MRLFAKLWLPVVCLAGLAATLPSGAQAYAGANGAFLVRMVLPDAAGRFGVRTDLFLMSTSGEIVQRLTDDSAWEYGARLAGDGQTLVFSSDRTGNPEIYTMRLDGSELRQITHDGDPTLNVHPTISADGGTIAWRRSSRTSGRDQIWETRNHAATVARAISPLGLFDNPELSPNGRLVAYDREATRGGIFLARHGHHGHLLWRGLGGGARFSPDGSRVAFVSFEGAGGWSIDSVGVHGTGEQMLFDAPSGYESDPVWSPDGTQIAFLREPHWPDSGSGQIVVMRADGSHPHAVASFDDDALQLLDWQAVPS